MRPPRLARWLLERALPFHNRPVMLGDLEEEFHARRREGRSARAWYWRQAVSSVPHAVGRRVPRIQWLLADIRFTLRMWRRQPSFVAAAIATQAVGIAVTTAVLAVAYAVLFRPLPYSEPARILHLFEGVGRSGQLSFQDFVDVRRASRTLASVAAYSGGSRTLTANGVEPERLPMVEVTEHFFGTLGVTPALGRTFTAAEMYRGSAEVVLLSHEMWVRRFGGNPDVIGRVVSLNGHPHEVIGVLPKSFAFPLRGRPELWLPLRPSRVQEERGYMHWMGAIARPHDGVSFDQVDADLATVAQLFAARDPKNHSGARLRALPLRDMVVAGVKPTIEALLAGAALVMLVTCATLATLLLSRAAPRGREFLVRSALGATRARIVLQLLTENVMLALAGGVLGVTLGHWLLQLFVAGMPLQQRVVLPHFENPGVGVGVGLMALALSVATGVLFGTVPAWRAAQVRVGASTGRVTAGTGETTLRSALVTLQVAIALVLLAGAGLLGASVHRLASVPIMADPEGLLTFRLNLPPKYDTAESIDAFNRRLIEELTSAPGVTGAALIDQPPLGGAGNNGTLTVVGRAEPSADAYPPVLIRSISDNYLSAMRVPVIRGRGFAATDTARSPQVVAINRVLADSVFAGTDPLEHRISFQFLPGEWQIIGVVENERFDAVDRPLLPVVYFSMRQDVTGSYTVMLRSGDPAASVQTARQVVGRLDPDLPMFGIRTVAQMAGESGAVFLRRATLWMLGVFAAASLLLAGMGLYGVLAQAVADRTREIGVRTALGATRARTVRLIVRAAAGAVVVGLALGIGATLAASRWLSSLLFDVTAHDPLIIAASTGFLLLVAMVACVIPTLRALSIDPATAIRLE